MALFHKKDPPHYSESARNVTTERDKCLTKQTWICQSRLKCLYMGVLKDLPKAKYSGLTCSPFLESKIREKDSKEMAVAVRGRAGYGGECVCCFRIFKR